MSYRNLKVHTVFNLFAIIVLSMVMINCVVAIFWYEHLVRQHLHTLQTHIDIELGAIYEEIVANKLTISEIDTALKTKKFHISKIVFHNIIINNNGSRPLKLTRTPQVFTADRIAAYFSYDSDISPALIQKFRQDVFSIPVKNKDRHIPVGVEINTTFLANQIWDREKIILVYILFNATILTTLIFFRFRKTLFTPMDNLLSKATNYQLHDGIWSVPSTNAGEFDQLSQAMDSMVKRIEKDRDTLISQVQELEKANVELQQAQQETIQAEKLAATGRLAAGFAHEIGNPVSIIQGYLELLLQNDFTDTEKIDFLNRSISELNRIDKLLFQLMDLAKRKKQTKALISPAQIYEEVTTTLQTALSKAGVTTRMSDADRSLFILGDPELLRQVFLNLLLNAIDAITEGSGTRQGQIVCSITSKRKKQGLFVAIAIEDNGCGFEEHISRRIFDPFFTTKPIGKGTGLGLSVVHKIIEGLGGHIEVASTPKHGTTFYISIPQSTKDNSDG